MSAKKKVIFCTYSSIYSSKVLEQLIVDTDINLVAIINSTRIFRPSLNHVQGAVTQLKASGLRYSFYLFLVTDVFRWIQPLLLFRKWPLRHIHALAKSNNIPVIDTRDINSPEVTGCIKKYKADYLLCAHFNQLIKEPVFEIDTMQCINIHPSLLPSYKGADPVFFAMRDEAEEIGVTLHKMNQGFDSGEILLQTSIKTDLQKSLFFNNCELYKEGITLALRWIKNESICLQPKLMNTESNESYYSWPSRTDVTTFIKSGKRLMHLSGLWKQQ